MKTHMETSQPIAVPKEMPQRPEYGAWLEFLALDGSTPPPAPVVFSDDPKREQAELVRIIGDRLREARELCNLSQSAAARRFGYQNPSKLSKVELATDTNSVPLWLIARAAKLYEVSVDFIFGLSADWETGVPRGAQPWIMDAWQKVRERDMAVLVRLHEEIAAVSKQVTALAAGAREVAGALQTVCLRNPGFIDMPASGTLDGRVQRLQEHARTAEGMLRRFQSSTRFATGSMEQA